MTTRINGTAPKDWRDLQRQVSQIFQECGLKSEIEKKIQTVRGIVETDVYAEDLSSQPKTIYLCECKHWQSAVPQTVVHAFRTVVTDYGANWGFIISSAGFQSGAFEAAAKSNVRLLTWDEFQESFVDRWIENYMMPRLREEVEPLVDYTEPSARVIRRADKLDKHSWRLFIQLRKKYEVLAYLAQYFYVPKPWLESQRIDLTLRKHIQNRKVSEVTNLPDELLDATCLRDFVDIICRHAREGVAAFDQVFGGRA
jgi:hypothetical protein